jgi:hypothetical protein
MKKKSSVSRRADYNAIFRANASGKIIASLPELQKGIYLNP